MKASPNTRHHYITPEQIESNRPGKEKCLQELVTALLSCYENYKALSVITQSAELKALYNNYADQRADYAYTLYINLSACHGAFVGENGNVIGLANPAWDNADIATIYSAVDVFIDGITSEREAIKKYDAYLRNHIPIIPHLRLLTSQKNAIKQTVRYLSESINLC